MPGTERRKRILRRVLFFVVAVPAVLVVLAIVLLDGFKVLTPRLPAPRPIGKTIVLLPQDGFRPEDPGWHWDRAGRDWFHHTSQGTTIMPYDWLVALEQPEVRVLRTPGLFLDPVFMSRFGFLPGAKDPHLNPGGKLPIGWAIARNFADPTADPNQPDAYNARPYNAVGLTCAACHTGRVTYQQPGGEEVEVLIEGGSAVINLRALQDALGRAVLYTLYVPGRFESFAGRVLGVKHAREARRRLRAQLTSWFDEAVAAQRRDDQRYVNQLESGFARTDALSLIGNRVFGPIAPGNVVAAVAPVNFPPIWGTSWFDWVQYNASIRMVMARNIGEALGVGARTNVQAGDPRLLQSSVNVRDLHLLEDQLGGPQPYRGLLAPRWEDAVKSAGFPELKPDLVQEGRALYETYCLKCHGPSVDELKQDLSSKETEPKYWTKLEGPPPFDKRFLKLPLSDLARIGTDPAQAADFASRFAVVPDPFPSDTRQALGELNPRQVGGGGPSQPLPATAGAGPTPGSPPATITVSAARGLRIITEVIRERAFQAAKLTPEERADWDRFRDHRAGLPDQAIIRANLKYKARPLDGVWATPPYLHNGSVPSLDALLSPVAARPGQFPIGTTEYDPDLVGYKLHGGDPNGFLLDTTRSGNYNTGHEFRDLTLLELEMFQGSGITDLGSNLTPDRRWARLLGLSAEDYAKLTEEQRRDKRRELSKQAIESPNATFFGVIGPGLDEHERQAIIEYVKSL
ncbi:MAG: hypothetical protein JOZ63_01945 [Planctomycetaceae bacterium]|nr:hypothetical protein [Planctomycetaceae bacterium]MBV8605978.1 hypothetical protein [Singulisphaera sp.]